MSLCFVMSHKDVIHLNSAFYFIYETSATTDGRYRGLVSRTGPGIRLV